MTIYTLITDFAIASIFILIGQFLRSKIKFIQSSFIPASLLAGIMGLFIGPAVLNLVPLSDNIGSYAGALVIIVFSAVGIEGMEFSKEDFKKDVNRMGEHLLYKLFAVAMQFFIPITVSILVISKLFPNINKAFGLTLAAGFYGGHGTAAAVGESLAKLGWTDALDISMTIATAGILTGIFGGLIFIKWATEKGYTQYVKNFDAISNDLKTGLIPKENRESMGEETISSVSLNSLAFHLSLVLAPSGIGYLLNQWIARTLGWDLPSFTVAFLVALLMFFVMGGPSRKGVYEYIDNKVIGELGSCITDYVVFFGVASIKIAVIIEYALPLAILVGTGILLVSVVLVYFGPRMNKGSWFERSIFVFGYATGVFAIGITLLRIVDPEGRSKTLSDTAIVGAILTPVEIFAWSAGPSMLMTGKHWQFVGVYAAMTLGTLILAKAMGWWYGSMPKAGRDPVD